MSESVCERERERERERVCVRACVSMYVCLPLRPFIRSRVEKVLLRMWCCVCGVPLHLYCRICRSAHAGLSLDHTYTHAYTDIYIHKHTHTHTITCIHQCTHTHTHTHTAHRRGSDSSGCGAAAVHPRAWAHAAHSDRCACE